MKITIAFVAVMVLSFTGYNVYKTQKAIQLSDVAMANVEAFLFSFYFLTLVDYLFIYSAYHFHGKATQLPSKANFFHRLTFSIIFKINY